MIDKTAIIHPGAQLASSVSVGPYSIIGEHVTLGEGTWIGPHVVITGHTQIGKYNKIYQFASIGEVPQDKKYRDEPTRLEIGDHNVIRESVTIHRGTVQDQGLTKIGSHNLFMAYTHIAHDCIVGNGNIFANACGIAGHVKVENYVIFSGYCGVHQFCQVGSYSFISHASLIGKDVPPYVMITGGANATVCGLNVEGLKRHGLTPEAIQWLRRAYKVIYRQGLRTEEAVAELRILQQECPEIKLLADFLQSTTRGIIR